VEVAGKEVKEVDFLSMVAEFVDDKGGGDEDMLGISLLTAAEVLMAGERSFSEAASPGATEIVSEEVSSGFFTRLGEQSGIGGMNFAEFANAATTRGWTGT